MTEPTWEPHTLSHDPLETAMPRHRVETPPTDAARRDLPSQVVRIRLRRARTAALLVPVMAVSGLAIALASAAFATTGHADSATTANLATNPGFESGAGGWFVASGATLGVGPGHTGSRSAVVTNTTKAAKTVALNDRKNTVASTVKGHVYEASVSTH